MEQEHSKDLEWRESTSLDLLRQIALAGNCSNLNGSGGRAHNLELRGGCVSHRDGLLRARGPSPRPCW